MDKVILQGMGGLSSYKFERVGGKVVFQAASGDDGDGHVDAYNASFEVVAFQAALEALENQDRVVVVITAGPLPPFKCVGETLMMVKGMKDGVVTVELHFDRCPGMYILPPVDISLLRL